MSKPNELTRKSESLAALVQSKGLQAQLARVLPRHLSADRMARVALTQLRRNPKLMACTPESFMNAMMKSSELGLEPDGRHAHLVPYGKECTLVPDYKGLAALARRSGETKVVHADLVRMGDHFDFGVDRQGPYLEHRPEPQRTGEVIGAYALVVMTDGTVVHEYMTTEEINTIRDRSPSGKSGPWVTDWGEMAKKTPFKRLSKWLDLSPEFNAAVDHDNELETRNITDDVTSSVVSRTAEIREPELPPPPSEPEPADEPPESEETEPAPEPKPEEPQPEPVDPPLKRAEKAARAAEADPEPAVGPREKAIATILKARTKMGAIKWKQMAVANEWPVETAEVEEASDEALLAIVRALS